LSADTKAGEFRDAGRWQTARWRAGRRRETARTWHSKPEADLDARPESRNPKSETTPKLKSEMSKTPAALQFGTLKFLLLNLFRVSGFGFRICPVMLAAFLAGCGRDDVRVYSVPKEAAPVVQAQAGLPPGHPALPATESAPITEPQLQWQLPAGWEQVAPGQMRAASFRVKGSKGNMADVGVFSLPGQAGSDLANVNRWRGQVGLAPVTDAELAGLGQAVEMPARQVARVYDLAGQIPGSTEKTRILGAILRGDEGAWFFKMTGDDALVAEQKEAFITFLKSVTFSSPTQKR
jgi:hypothetical protein